MPLLVSCGVQIIYSLKTQLFEYILSVLMHFHPKRIFIVFVYMNLNTLGELPTNALLLMCATLCEDLFIEVCVYCHLIFPLILSDL